MLREGIRLAHGGELPPFTAGKTATVILVAHYVVAEYSALADRNGDYITGSLLNIRKTAVTGFKPIQRFLSDHSLVNIHIFDTKLLAPATHQSLEALSSLLPKSYSLSLGGTFPLLVPVTDQSPVAQLPVLAPVHRSIEDLKPVLVAEDSEKLDISQFDKENMHQFLLRDPEGFENYAIRDAELCVELFLLLQTQLNRLVAGPDFKLYHTLAAAAVDGFLLRTPDFPAYRSALRQKKYWPAHRIAERAYHGGRNEAYFLGSTQNEGSKVYADIDICGCYPTEVALVPKIDIDGEVDYLPVRYRLDDEAVCRLEAERVPPEIVERARTILDTSETAFEDYLKNLNNYRLSSLLRHHAQVVDNRLIDDWKRRSDLFHEGQSDALERYLIPGFALVRFKFPSKRLFPCLPEREPYYGLVYALEGETYATAAEIILAMDAGAEIEALTSVEYPVVLDGEGYPERFLLPSIKDDLATRAHYKKDKYNPAAPVLEKLSKEFVNSKYGKFAQAVNPRNVVRVSDNSSQKLGPSKMTEPVIASLVTGGARAALSAMLLGVEQFNQNRPAEDQVCVISATTDGVLLGLPAPEGYTVVGDYYSDPTPEERQAGHSPAFIGGDAPAFEAVCERFDCAELVTTIESFLPCRQLKRSRQDLTGNDTCFEVKHMADEVHSYKTRFQIGQLSTGDCSLLARGGLRPPLRALYDDPEEYKTVISAGGVVKATREAQWILEQISYQEGNDGKLSDYDFMTLTSFKDMLENPDLDLTKQVSQRVFNADFDWKRSVVERDDPDADGGRSLSPFTVPHQNLAQMKKMRGVAQGIRKGGYAADVQTVLTRIRQQDRRIKIRGGLEQTVTRMFIRGVLQGVIPLADSSLSYKQMAQRVNDVWDGLADTVKKKVWSVNDFKNGARSGFERGIYEPNPSLVGLIHLLAQAFGADGDQVADLIFVSDASVKERSDLLGKVLLAILHGPRQGAEPFASLYIEGVLPPRSGLLDAFYPLVSEDQLDVLGEKSFCPSSCSADERKRLKRLLYRIGITGHVADACVRTMAPPHPPKEHRSKTPKSRGCLEKFVMALHQPDIALRRPYKVRVLNQLASYGLKDSDYKDLVQRKFQPYCLSNTPANRRQIRSMSALLGVDAQPFLKALLRA